MGHSMRLQSAPIHPELQLHCRADVEPSVDDSHEPCPLQWLGEHGCACTDSEDGLLKEKVKIPRDTAVARLIVVGILENVACVLRGYL